MLAPIGFTSPLLLGLIPLSLGYLLYIYLKRGAGQKIVVSSTLIFGQLHRFSVARKNLNIPWRLLLELALFCLLALGAAGTFLSGSGERIALIIDNSFSMSAWSSPAHNQTLLDIAKNSARQYLRSLPSTAQVKVFQVAPNLTSIKSAWSYPDSAINDVTQMGVGYGSSSLEGNLAALGTSAEFSQIFLITDQKPLLKNEAMPERVVVKVVSGDVPLENLAITDIALQTTPLAEQNKSLEVSVAAFVNQATKANLKSYYFDSSSQTFAEISSKDLDLQPAAIVKVYFSNLPEAPLYKVQISNSDFLAADNQAFISSTPFKKQMLVVSNNSSEKLGLERIKFVDFKAISPQNYSEIAAQNTLPVIFHNVAPSQLPNSDAIFINPPSDSIEFAPGELSKNSAITDWLESHPLMTYLNIGALQIPALRPLHQPNWATTVINSSVGPALVAGELNQHHYAALGFEILPFEGSESPLLSVLSLNLLKWLLNSSIGGGYLPPYSTLSTENNSKIYLDQPGYKAINLSNGTTKYVAVNFFTPSESNTLSPQSFQVTDFKAAALNQETGRSCVFWLLKVALLILFIDFAFSILRLRFKRWTFN